jgi:hypothetical protein
MDFQIEANATPGSMSPPSLIIIAWSRAQENIVLQTPICHHDLHALAYRDASLSCTHLWSSTADPTGDDMTRPTHLSHCQDNSCNTSNDNNNTNVVIYARDKRPQLFHQRKQKVFSLHEDFLPCSFCFFSFFLLLGLGGFVTVRRSLTHSLTLHSFWGSLSLFLFAWSTGTRRTSQRLEEEIAAAATVAHSLTHSPSLCAAHIVMPTHLPSSTT